jgi:putative phosphoribosyl transferase
MPQGKPPTVFTDRAEAGRRLAEHLDQWLHVPPGDGVVVLGLPRGGVPVAREVATALSAPLDVIAVRRLPVPRRPELSMGAVAEGGTLVVNGPMVAGAGVRPGDLAAAEEREWAEVARLGRRYRGPSRSLPLTNRLALIVDDGLASGQTATAACRTARRRGAYRIVVAVPVAPSDTVLRLRAEADEVIALHCHEDLLAAGARQGIGHWYAAYHSLSDADVRACLLGTSPAPAFA